MRSSFRKRAIAMSFVVIGTLAGCDRSLCARNSDCAIGLVCTREATCAVAPSDGGGDDSTVTDVPPADAAIDSIVDVAFDAPPDAPLDGGP